jgi:hypothetical protein
MADPVQNHLKKFLARNRKRRTDGLTETTTFPPVKQAKVPPYRPVKRSRKTY